MKAFHGQSLLTFNGEEGAGLDTAQIQRVLSGILDTRLVDDQTVGVAVVLELVLVTGKTLLQCPAITEVSSGYWSLVLTLSNSHLTSSKIEYVLGGNTANTTG